MPIVIHTIAGNGTFALFIDSDDSGATGYEIWLDGSLLDTYTGYAFGDVPEGNAYDWGVPVENCQPHTLYLKAVDGTEESSNTVTFTPRATETHSAVPTGLSGSCSTSSIVTLDWTNPAASPYGWSYQTYVEYRDARGVWLDLGSVGGAPSYVSRAGAFLDGESIEFRVYSVDGIGRKGAYSAVETVAIVDSATYSLSFDVDTVLDCIRVVASPYPQDIVHWSIYQDATLVLDQDTEMTPEGGGIPHVFASPGSKTYTGTGTRRNGDVLTIASTTLSVVYNPLLYTSPYDDSAEVYNAPIAAPTFSPGRVGDGKVYLKWDQRRYISAYELYQDGTLIKTLTVPNSIRSVFDFEVEDGGTVTSEVVVDGLTNGTNYTFTLKAVHPGGTTDFSDPYDLTPIGCARTFAFASLVNAPARQDVPNTAVPWI